MSKKINVQNILIKKLKVKYLRKYLQNQIHLLKKFQKKYTQHGGASPIRAPGISSFITDAPNIISRSINIYWRVSTILEKLNDIADTYDETGAIKEVLDLITSITSSLKVFITFYGMIMKLFSGKWNKKIIFEVNEFERKMSEGKHNSEEDFDWKELHKLLHEIKESIEKKGDQVGGGPKVSDKAATEIAVLALQTEKVLKEITEKTGKTIQISNKITQEFGDPFEKINETITNVITGIVDSAKVIPGVAQVLAPISILDKVTKNADLVLSIVESNLMLIEEVLDDNLEYDKEQQKWIVPLVEHSKVWFELVRNSPELLRLLKSTGNSIADDVIDETIPQSGDLLNSDWVAKGLAKNMQKEVNKFIDSNLMPAKEWEDDHVEIHNGNISRERYKHTNWDRVNGLK